MAVDLLHFSASREMLPPGPRCNFVTLPVQRPSPRHRRVACDAIETASTSAVPLPGSERCRRPSPVLYDWCPSDWAAGYVDLKEHSNWAELTFTGQLPRELKGTYLRNGPARFRTGQHAVAHPFDGDGAISCVRFSNGRAFFRARLVQTSGLQADMGAGAPQFRGVFGTQLPGGQRGNALEVALKNTANTGLLFWHGRLFALMEAGQPYEIDPASLETMGPSTFGGALERGLPFQVQGAPLLQRGAEAALSRLRRARGRHPEGVKLGGDALAAHYRQDPTSGRLVTLSYRILVTAAAFVPGNSGGLKTVLTFHEYAPDFSLLSEVHHTIDGYAFVHDFAITQHSIVVLQNPVALDLMPLIDGSLCPIHCISHDPEAPMLVHVLPRERQDRGQPRHAARSERTAAAAEGAVGACDWDDDADQWGAEPGDAGERPQARVYAAPSHFVQHIANAWESRGPAGQQQLTVQYVAYETMPDFAGWSGPGRRWQDTDPDRQPCSHLHSLTVDCDAGTATSERVAARVCEFPKVDPRRVGLPTRYVYAGASLHPTLNRPQQAVAAYDTATGGVQLWSRGWRYYVGEPEFVPRAGGGERDGWLVCLCFDAEAGASEVVVLDASRVGDGPVAVARLPTVVPHGLHGAWLDCSERAV